MLESYYKQQPNPRRVPEFTDALPLLWSALSEKDIDNAVRDYHKQLQACVRPQATANCYIWLARLFFWWLDS